MNILENCINKYIDILIKNYNLDTKLINNFIKDQNWSLKIKKEKYIADIYNDYHGNKYYLINSDLGIKIIE